MGNLGKLNIVISAVNKTKAVFNQVSQSLNKIKSGVGKALKVFGGLTAAIGGVGFALAALGKQSFAYIDTLGKTSDQLGVSVEFLQAFQIAAEEAGSSSEGANKALLKFSKNIGEAGRGLKTQADLFKDLGVSIRDSSGNLKGTEQLLLETADGIAALGSSAEKNSALTNLFGRSGQQLFAILNQGGDAVAGLKDKMLELGIGISSEAVDAVERFNDTSNILSRQLNSLKDNVFAAFLPILQTFVNQFTTMFKTFAEGEGGIQKFSQALATNIIDGVQTALLAMQELVLGGSRMVTSLQESLLQITNFFGRNEEAINSLLDRQNEFEQRTIEGFTGVMTKVGEYRNMIGSSVEAMNTLTNGTDEFANRGTQAFTDALSPLAKYKQELGDTGKAIENTTVKAMKKFEDTLVDGLMTGKFAFKDFSNFVIKELLRIAIRKLIIDKITGGFTSFLGGLGGKERGGTVTANRPYLVGEAGAELFVPNKTGTIVPNNRLGGGMGSGGMPVNITYNIQAFDSKDTLSAITENAPTISAIIESEFNKRGRRGFVTWVAVSQHHLQQVA